MTRKRTSSSKTKSSKRANRRGCCIVNFNGSTLPYNNKTENQCAAIARNYPGATYDFRPGKDCK